MNMYEITIRVALEDARHREEHPCELCAFNGDSGNLCMEVGNCGSDGYYKIYGWSDVKEIPND